ncbi:mRNA cap guanine-N7 methyltransferase [Wyeomyia smithii]|uniref:mRNA cap guanine-N7 methyltransferase n=1 Tax=Wyeomyia smithii TaxID=174621 RepID=UPI002467FD09|nr:mRNA cap guanine-N7 methyltransferase [Wyeomyia smithii]XP_055526382.1 mRNA cap guanine-N7 methyltransferase [Wyeomyia smithii]XP_055526383.1 mRNA cap guanine-N7 methyltransferase [Wyeomyia smithii]
MSETVETVTFGQPQRLSEDSETGDEHEVPDSGPVAPVAEFTEPGQSKLGKRSLSADSDDDEPEAKRAAGEHTTVVATHYNQIEERGLAERNRSRIFYMRNFNNWVKSILINKYLAMVKGKASLGTPLRVMDMCCGKGGDLLKWLKGNITHLICTDIAEISVKQCEERYKKMTPMNDGKLFTAEFITADATLQQLRTKFKDPSLKLHLVSCQFAFHYSFESLKQAERMMKNAAECLQEGGYFIGTIPDANEIMKRQRAAGSDCFGNDVYKITLLCDTETPPLFGAKYNFQLDGVVDCPEFLVHFPTLEKLARKLGLRLVEKKRFDECYEESIGSWQPLIEKMQALETFPSHSHYDRERQQNQPEQYAHVQQFYDRNGRCKLGTLSLQEWEASTLYLFFAFQKMKTQWDAKGNAVYS